MIRPLAIAALGALVLVGAGGASSGPQILEVSAAPLFSNPETRARLPADIRFAFAGEAVEVVQVMRSTRSNRASVKGARTLSDACRWALLGALKGMGEQARAAGANGIVNIRSVLDELPSSDGAVRCRTSNNVVHVAISADLAQVK
jgi:uncharacterized protein YbjQ (UPF0145 family)